MDGHMQAAVRGEADPHIVQLESRLRAAQLSGDVDALRELISDNLLFAGPDGHLYSRDQDLAAHASGTVRFRVHEPRELRVRPVTENVAATALLAWLVIEIGDTLVEGMHRYTRVWAREADDVWRVVAGHVSSVLTPD